MTEKIDKTPQIDPEAIRKYCEFAHAHPLDASKMADWPKRDPQGFREHMDRFCLYVEPGYLCVYQIDIISYGRFQEHFSVRSKFEMDIDVIEKLAVAFGLGDRTTWSMVMPPSPPIVQGYHIIKLMPVRGRTH